MRPRSPKLSQTAGSSPEAGVTVRHARGRGEGTTMQIEPIPIAAAPSNSHQAELYLHTVEELSGQLEQAMEAIVARSLPAFQQSVSQQRMTCSQLLAMPRYLDADRAFTGSSLDSGVDADLSARIVAAGEALQTLNKRYSTLLGHTGDTIRLLARLLGGYGFPAAAGLAVDPANRSTWSCEG